MNIETSIASSAPMSIGTKIAHPNEMSTEAKIETARVETLIDIVMTTRTHRLGAMMDSLRQRGTETALVAGMVESTSGWCSKRCNVVELPCPFTPSTSPSHHGPNTRASEALARIATSCGNPDSSLNPNLAPSPRTVSWGAEETKITTGSRWCPTAAVGGVLAVLTASQLFFHRMPITIRFPLR
jgi:hypothetical protein